MSKDQPLFETPKLKHSFGDSEKIKFIVSTDSFAYIITEEGKMYRTLFVNFKLPIKQEFTEIHSLGKIKKIVPIYRGSQYRQYTLLVLVNQKLYAIPEDATQSKITPTQITSISDPIDDFCVTPNREKICVISKKRLIFLTVGNNYNQIGKYVDVQDSNIVCDNYSVIIYGKGEKMYNFTKDQLTDLTTGPSNKIGIVQGNIEKYFDRKLLEQTISYQYYSIKKNEPGNVNFIGQGPYSSFKLNVPSDIVDFTINYPYAFVTYGKTFSMTCIPFEIMNQKYEFPFQFTSQTLCVLPNRMALVGVANNLYLIKFTEACSQVKLVESGGDTTLLMAIMLCLSFPETEKDISHIEHQLFHKYGVYHLKQNKIPEAFTFFLRDTMPPMQVLSYFPDICPSESLLEVELHKKAPLQVADKSVTGIESYDAEKVKALQNYIYEILKTQKFDAATMRGIDSTLVKCIAITEPSKFESFIQEHKDIYFDSTSTFFMNLSAVSHFCMLCQVHGQHDRALRYFKQRKHCETEIIDYIQKSPDFAKLARLHFKDIAKTAPEKAPEVFCSPNLEISQVLEGGSGAKDESLLSFIQNLRNTPESYQKVDPDFVETRFLRFCIFEKNFRDKRLCSRLCDLYINKLQPLAQSRAGKPYISISQETEPNKSTRMGLIKVLELGEVEIDIDPVFIEEKVYSVVSSFSKLNLNGGTDRDKSMKQNFFTKLSGCFDLLCKEEIDFSIALDFCEKTSKKLSIDPKEIYTLLLTKLVEVDSDSNRERMVALVNKKADEINYAEAIAALPSSVTLNDISTLLATVSVDRVNDLRRYQIENALLEETLKRKKQQLQYLRGGYAHITSNTFCAICGREFHDQLFYVRPDNTVTHIMCLDSPNSTDGNNIGRN